MKDMFTVLKYTIKENITKKAFIIATAILMAIIIIVCNVPNIINLFSDENETPESAKFIVVDSQNLIGEELNSIIEIGKTMYWDIEIKNEISDEITQKIKDDELNGMIEIFKNEETQMLKLQYTSKGSLFMEDYTIADQFASVIK